MRLLFASPSDQWPLAVSAQLNAMRGKGDRNASHSARATRWQPERQQQREMPPTAGHSGRGGAEGRILMHATGKHWEGRFCACQFRVGLPEKQLVFYTQRKV